MGSVARADTPIRLKVVYKTPHNLLAEFTRSRIRDAAAHLLKLGRALDETIGGTR